VPLRTFKRSCGRPSNNENLESKDFHTGRQRALFAMAEFVSAIIGLIAVGANMSNNLHTLIDTFKNAPNEILALFNEVNDFRTMLSSLLEINNLEERTLEEHDTAEICLNGTVKNGQHIIEKIEALIIKVRRERLEKDGETQVNKFQ
jgi:hypothetical protein